MNMWPNTSTLAFNPHSFFSGGLVEQLVGWMGQDMVLELMSVERPNSGSLGANISLSLKAWGTASFLYASFDGTIEV